MGLFHKTLKNAEAHLKTGNIRQAAAIIKGHLKDEHKFDSNLARLNRLIGAYHNKLEELSKMDPKGDPKFYLDEIESAMMLVQNIQAEIQILQKEGKVDLE
jgi:hypothetical protein